MEYRERAEAAARAGAASILMHVRAMHLRAAEKWTELAQAEDRRARELRAFRGPTAQR